MDIINTENGTILGIQLFQRKAVRNEYEKWFKAHHSSAWVIDWICSIPAAIGIYRWINGMLYGELLALTPLIILGFVHLHYIKRYNDQASPELKRK